LQFPVSYTRHFVKLLLGHRGSPSSVGLSVVFAGVGTATLFAKLWFERGLVLLGNVCNCEGLA